MTFTYEPSKSLIDYGHAVREWAVSTCRPLARETDERHSLPANYLAVLDSAPVPLGRIDTPHAEPIPTFPDGYWVTKQVMTEAITQGDTWVQASLNPGMGHLVVQLTGTAQQQDRWVRPVLDHGVRGAFALTEPGFGSDASRIATTATRDGNEWVVDGSKIFCTNGASADYITVFAAVDSAEGRRQTAAFIVPRPHPGVTVLKANESKLGLRAWQTSALSFDGCRIPLDHRIGWTSTGPSDEASATSGLGAALAALSNNRPTISMMAVGLAVASLDIATSELRHRRLGFSLARWSAIESDLERMRAAVDRGRRLALSAQWVADQGQASRFLSAAAKAFMPETAERIIYRCMQLLGPEGTSKDLLLEKWYRDSKILDIFEGTGQIQRFIVARTLLGSAAG